MSGASPFTFTPPAPQPAAFPAGGVYTAADGFRGSVPYGQPAAFSGFEPGFDSARPSSSSFATAASARAAAAPAAAFASRFNSDETWKPAEPVYPKPPAEAMLLPSQRPQAELDADAAALAASVRAPTMASCQHALLSDCLKLASLELVSDGQQFIDTCWTHSICIAGVPLPNCIHGDTSSEEDRHDWVRAVAGGAEQQQLYYQQRKFRLDTMRARRAAVQLDPRLLHGLQLPVCFGAQAGVAPLAVNFGRAAPVISGSPSLADLAAQAVHEDELLVASATAAQAYVASEAYATNLASKRAVYAPLTYAQAQQWKRDGTEWRSAVPGHTDDRRTLHLKLLLGQGIAKDVAHLVLDYLEPPHYSVVERFGLTHATKYRGRISMPSSAGDGGGVVRAVAVAVDSSVYREGCITFNPQWHPKALAAMANSAAAKERATAGGRVPSLTLTYHSSMPPDSIVKDHIQFAAGVEESRGWGTIPSFSCLGYAGWPTVYGCEVYYVRERKHNIETTPAYDFLSEPVQPRKIMQEELEPGWCCCEKCAQLWRSTDSGAGACALGGEHVAPPEGGQGHDYSLVRDLVGPDIPLTQGGWRRCRKCAVLFHGPSIENSACPAAAADASAASSSAAAGSAPPLHDPTGSAEYHLHTSRMYEPPQCVGGEVAWRQCFHCASLVSASVSKGELAVWQCPAKPLPRGRHAPRGAHFEIVRTAKPTEDAEPAPPAAAAPNHEEPAAALLGPLLPDDAHRQY